MMNPYQFVPFGAPAELKPVETHEQFKGNLHTGTLTCRITTLTEIFVSGQQERVPRDQHQKLQFCRDGNLPIIPGSSLKGSIRNVFEALSGSCLPLAGEPRRRRVRNDMLSYWDRKRQHDYDLPDGFPPCSMRREFEKEKKACPACRTFGLLHSASVHLGRVHFSDARLLNSPEFREITLEPFGAPGPRHRAFYGTPDSRTKKARGRKFYFHRIEGARTTTSKSGQNKTVEACLPDAAFEFTVEYEGLREEDLTLLVFSLILEEPMRHKIGMGKGVGMGSVKIEITGWQKINLADRYRTIGGGMTSIPEADLDMALQHSRENYHRQFANCRASFEALRAIWTWDKAQPRDPQYPSYMWFKENSQVPLENVPEDAGQYKVRPHLQAPVRQQPRESAPAAAQEDTATLKRLQKQAEKQQQREALAEAPYQNRDVDKATIISVTDMTFEVSLPRIEGKTFEVKKKNPYRPYQAGAKIRVRVLLNAGGEITRVEEV